MPRRKPTTLPPSKKAAPAPKAPQPPVKSKRQRKLVFGLALVGFLVGVAWGAWEVLGPNSLRDARAALDQRDFHAADEILTKYLSKNPDSPQALFLAARTARRAGEFARAKEHLGTYLRKNPANEAYELESSLLAVQSGNLTNADRLFESFVGRPDAPETPFVMEAYLEGKLKVLAPNHTATIDTERDDPAVVTRLHKAADTWLAQRPGRADQVQGLTWRGRVYAYARDQAQSVTALREALALDPDHFDARLYLALGISQVQPQECVRHLEILREKKPDDRRLRYLVATGQRTLGNFTESRKLLDQMLADDPNSLSALVELGLLNLDESKLANAEPMLRKALKLAPNIPETNSAMSRCEALLGHPAEAAQYRKRFEEITAERNRPRTPPAPKP
ncbi:pep-cterm system tpr-repeat lipoprotein : TPR repeat protein OS=Nitrosococcus oceani (strain ATCC 19707 / NCIMB 11848) GN=Noc_1987 PE=4 SV=1: TPR_16: TPR_2: TPR_8 [Gemmata massiliana]|uniref:Tetratricopeptide repeat protein n=1 Tax=Gemmata massiliana TaxID=1210884 RepID=A0A6P2CS45_9BACT|nr:tetratricopeptide repeat protein [Gemmata massiliana]VTR91733.1 pep-cterm system tpr-repeat lipoprotein : TPR repeat protein OS=Nitrosococcus oceani (strain ATCC 19707 / NCIMB 11848) GN=Noc_1987 PE=4 SV=1: TPR_16: TPR_2: TPR_8 [Gemmata massiliana]